MQTHEWEALLEGTADGPWKAERHGREEVISICTTVHTPKRFVGDIYGEGNARLAAHAPAAVAEVIRLLREIESLRADCCQTVIDPRGHEDMTPTSTAHHIALDCFARLTHILEGETNE